MSLIMFLILLSLTRTATSNYSRTMMALRILALEVRLIHPARATEARTSHQKGKEEWLHANCLAPPRGERSP